MQKILFLVLFITILPVSLFAETFDKGKCDIIETDVNVIKKLREQGIYKDNKTGIVCFNIEGSSFMFPLKNGKKEGIGKSYYESGALQGEIPFKNGKIEGMVKFYHVTGALQVEIPYKNDKREGIGKVYYENGKKFANITYQNNILISGKCANGRKWTSEEINNLEKGLEVDCGR